MATLDPASGTVVIRIVYDGKPYSGKTTSLRALGGTLGRPVVSPGEAEGRTLYFDWLDYTAGRFEGHPIRCQVVSVPGQGTLAARRRRLLAEADAVVLVADTGGPGLDEALEQADDLLGFLRGLPGPPVGVIFQANKRDVPGALAAGDLRRLVDPKGLALVESVATEGSGVREGFVFAVRLALDRVGQMSREGSLPEGPPRVEGAADLLDELLRGEEEGLAAAGLREVLARTGETPLREPDGEDAEGPIFAPPFELAPSGMIWPPVEGRIILRQAFPEPVPLGPDGKGGWEDARPGWAWRVHSAAGAVYADAEEGRRDLVEWARLHAESASWLSPARCLVLAPLGRSLSLRLWQAVRAERTCGELMREALEAPSEEQAGRLLEAVHLFLRGVVRLRSAGLPLPLTLETVGVLDSKPLFVGLMPFRSLEGGDGGMEPDAEALMVGEVEPELRRAHATRPLAVPALLAGLEKTGPGLQDTARELSRLLARL